MKTDLLILQLQPFAIALAIGLIIGIERERSHPPGQQPLGSRTFVLFSLLGALAARLTEPVVAVALTLFVGAVVIAGYWRSSRHTETEKDIGFTTEVAAVLTYGLGFLAHREGFIAIIIGVVALVVLMARTRLHIFSRKQLKPKELEASAVLLVLGIVIIPFLPNHAIDPLGFFNPQRFGLLILIILLLQFFAYLSIRLLGQSLGILLLGFLAGFVSSSNLTATIASKSKQNEVEPLIASCSVILACSGMFLEVLIIIYIISPSLLFDTILPVAASGIAMSLFVMVCRRITKDSSYIPPTQNPLAILSALRLGVFLTVMLLLVSLAQRFLGPHWVNLVTFLGALIEIRGVMMAISTLHAIGKLNQLNALHLVILALSSTFVTKFILVWTAGSRRFASYTTGMFIMMFALMLVVLLTQTSLMQVF